MPAHRYFIEAFFEQGKEVSLLNPERHHLIVVMRAQKEDRVELVNGKNQLAEASLSTIDKKAAHLKIEKVTESATPYPLILCQAIPRFNHLEIVLEKATELGATEIWLFPGERSDKSSFTNNQLSRMQMILISAMKQCGRLDLPRLLLKPSLLQWKTLPFPAYIGDLSPTAPLLRSCWEKKEGCCIFIGPEGGFSQKELFYLHALGAKSVQLHPLTLRAETASISALFF